VKYKFNFLSFVVLKVSWVRRRDDQLHLITFGPSIYISDSRYSLEFKEPNDWQLHIQYVNERDEGQFECQINTSPPLILVVHLEVIGKSTRLFPFFSFLLLSLREISIERYQIVSESLKESMLFLYALKFHFFDAG
jgi:Immunoglobulin I-set domain